MIAEVEGMAGVELRVADIAEKEGGLSSRVADSGRGGETSLLSQ